MSKKKFALLLALTSASVPTTYADSGDEKEAAQSNLIVCFGYNFVKDCALVVLGGLIQSFIQERMVVKEKNFFGFVSREDKFEFLTKKWHGALGITLMSAFLFLLALCIEFFAYTRVDHEKEKGGFKIFRALKYFGFLLLGAWMMNMFVITQGNIVKVQYIPMENLKKRLGDGFKKNQWLHTLYHWGVVQLAVGIVVAAIFEVIFMVSKSVIKKKEEESS
ncbi:MAG: hypothetical protein AAF335_00640 [Bacteroidota bacterium]